MHQPRATCFLNPRGGINQLDLPLDRRSTASRCTGRPSRPPSSSSRSCSGSGAPPHRVQCHGVDICCTVLWPRSQTNCLHRASSIATRNQRSKAPSWWLISLRPRRIAIANFAVLMVFMAAEAKATSVCKAFLCTCALPLPWRTCRQRL